MKAYSDFNGVVPEGGVQVTVEGSLVRLFLIMPKTKLPLKVKSVNSWFVRM
ncbi:hypothetical protein SFC43_01645 [Bacteroides sp. CR5/BHMF/2]|nr:hypothetical protein [Bacteroides sp. CR5/BHMF/2]